MKDIDATLIPIIEEKFKEMIKNFEQLVPEARIEAPVSHLVRNCVETFILNIAKDKVYKNLDRLVIRNIDDFLLDKNIKPIIKHEISRAFFCSEFREQLIDRVGIWLDRKFPN